MTHVKTVKEVFEIILKSNTLRSVQCQYLEPRVKQKRRKYRGMRFSELFSMPHSIPYFNKTDESLIIS